MSFCRVQGWRYLHKLRGNGRLISDQESFRHSRTATFFPPLRCLCDTCESCQRNLRTRRLTSGFSTPATRKKTRLESEHARHTQTEMSKDLNLCWRFARQAPPRRPAVSVDLISLRRAVGSRSFGCQDQERSLHSTMSCSTLFDTSRDHSHDQRL